MRHYLVVILVAAGCGSVQLLPDAGDESPDAPGATDAAALPDDAPAGADAPAGTDGGVDAPNPSACRTCGGGDNCCAFDGAGGCSAANDAECAGPSWQAMTWPRPANYMTVGQCDVIEVHGIVAGGSYVFTTCAPGGMSGTGDPLVMSVVDGDGTVYPVNNDDCGDANALPRLAGWQCTNSMGAPFHFCASATPGGFRALGSSGILRITVCPYSGPQGQSGAGSAPFNIWYNAPTAPYSP